MKSYLNRIDEKVFRSQHEMLKLTCTAYDLSGGEFCFRLHESTFPLRDFFKNRTKLLTVLISDSAMGLPLHQMRGTFNLAWHFF